MLPTCPLGQQVGGSNGRVGITHGSHKDFGMSGRITLRRTTARMRRTAGTAQGENKALPALQARRGASYPVRTVGWHLKTPPVLCC
jgi:hypothetical protein